MLEASAAFVGSSVTAPEERAKRQRAPPPLFSSTSFSPCVVGQRIEVACAKAKRKAEADAKGPEVVAAEAAVRLPHREQSPLLSR